MKKSTPRPLSRDDLRAALFAISPDLDRDAWLRIGMALHSELPGDDGSALFDEWCRNGQTYNARDVRDVWRSFKPGRITVATLIAEAKRHGWHPSEPITPEAAAERERRRREAAERRAADDAKFRAKADEAARNAAALWARASEHGESPYLARKGVGAHGVRFLPDRTLIVPMRNAAGELVNVQRIAPERPPDGKPEKTFLRWGRKSGAWHMVGDDELCAAADAIVIAEGYATAASIFEATGRPVAVAFDCGNLRHVAQALAELYPAARLLIAGDDDRATRGNPGRTKAAAAARAVGGLAVFPEPLPDGGSDFNDVRQSAGLDAVRDMIERACAELLAMPERDAKSTQEALSGADGASASPDAENAASGPPEATAGLPFGFELRGDGWLCYRDSGEGNGPPRMVPVCSRLAVIARTHDRDGDGWGFLLEFDDPAGRVRTWPMPARMLAGDGNEYRSALLGMGLRIAPGVKAKNLLGLYLQQSTPAAFVRCVDRVGWHGRAFVMPRETLQREPAEGEPRPAAIVFQSEGPAENKFKRRGSAADWRNTIGAFARGNSRLMFALSCAFAAPLLRPSGLNSGGFHFRGSSSVGKSKALEAAASVYGGPDFMRTWRNTSNALESIAAAHCDVLLCLDELAQVDAKEAGESAYMLAGETGKGRASRTGQARPLLTWKTLFLSSGEVSLAQHMAEGGKRIRAGQDLRMADIAAEVSPGTSFETLHGFEHGAAFADAISRAAEANHGHTGAEWLRWCVDHVDELRDLVRSGIEDTAGAWVPEHASGQVHRAGRRFALVAVAGEMATRVGLTGWVKGAATAAARACFEAWLAARPGGIGDAETEQMLRQARAWLQLNGAGRFTWWHRALDDRAPDKGLRAGLRRMVTKDGTPIKSDSDHQREFGERIGAADAEETTVDYYCFPEIFEREACDGFDAAAVLRLLRDRGHLVPGHGAHLARRERLPGLGLVRCYRIKSTIFEG
jgi:putative DNA primase/helicase